MSPSLPPAPSLEQLRKQAKDLLRAHRRGDPAAIARVAAQADADRTLRGGAARPDATGEGAAPAPSAPLRLAGAQLVVAREHGFRSWPRLRAYLDRVAVHGPGLQHAFHEDLGYYAERADGLLASARDDTATAAAPFERWAAPLTRAGARTVIAREHGFPSWPALRGHVKSLRSEGEPFARAYRAVEGHELDALRALLDRFPTLVHARGTNGNDLLGMASATADERLVALLLDRGADPAAANAHGWTALHQAGYMGHPRLARLLLDAGAPAGGFARGDGGTPLVAALFWGHRETAELLAARGGALPGNLRVAAGLGDLARIESLVAPGGSLAAEAGAHRGFYRPHSGFPAWRPSDEPQEVLDEALAWAARNDRAEALTLLVARGARPDADVYRGTALAWAAFAGRAAAIRALVGLGADVNARTGFGGLDHGDGATALHLAAQCGRLDAIRALLEAGADHRLTDRRHGGTPAQWAGHGCEKEAERLLLALG